MKKMSGWLARLLGGFRSSCSRSMTMADFGIHFAEIARRHNLENKAGCHEFYSARYSHLRLFRIVKEENSPHVPLPEEFVAEVRALAEKCGYGRIFEVSLRGLTMKEIEIHQRVFALDCAVAND